MIVVFSNPTIFCASHSQKDKLKAAKAGLFTSIFTKFVICKV